jgi:hypothetical protein
MLMLQLAEDGDSNARYKTAAILARMQDSKQAGLNVKLPLAHEPSP